MLRPMSAEHCEQAKLITGRMNFLCMEKVPHAFLVECQLSIVCMPKCDLGRPHQTLVEYFVDQIKRGNATPYFS